mgnify:CR=1 FL=1
MKKKFIYMITTINNKETYLGYIGEQTGGYILGNVYNNKYLTIRRFGCGVELLDIDNGAIVGTDTIKYYDNPQCVMLYKVKVGNLIEIEECKLVNSESRMITDDGYDICYAYHEFYKYIKDKHLTKFPVFNNRSIYVFDIENKSYIRYTSEVIENATMRDLYCNGNVMRIIDYVIDTYMKNDIDETDKIYDRLRYVEDSSIAQYNIKNPLINHYKKKVVPLDDKDIKRILEEGKKNK